MIIGANSLLIFEFVQSKKRVYTNEQLINNKAFRANLRSTIIHACVYSFSFVVISLPKMISLLLGFFYRDMNYYSANLTSIFEIQGNCYFVLNFFFLLVMNKQFLNEIKLIFVAFGILKVRNENFSQLMNTRKQTLNA